MKRTIIGDYAVIFVAATIMVIIAIPAVVFVAGAWKLDEVMQRRFGK